MEEGRAYRTVCKFTDVLTRHGSEQEPKILWAQEVRTLGREEQSVQWSTWTS